MGDKHNKQKLYIIQFKTCHTKHFQITGQNTEKNVKKGHLGDVYDPHTQVKCLLKALIFGTCRKDIIMHSQMGFQLHQSHSLTVTGLKGGKKSKYWVSVGLLEISMWPSN